MPILSIEQTRCFEVDFRGGPVAPPRPAPRTRQSKSAPPSSAGRSPSPSGRAPARRLSAEDAVDELRGMEWLALCGLDEPSRSRSLEDGEDDPLWAEWAERSGL